MTVGKSLHWTFTALFVKRDEVGSSLEMAQQMEVPILCMTNWRRQKERILVKHLFQYLSSEMRVILSAGVRGHLAMFRGTFGCHNWGGVLLASSE